MSDIEWTDKTWQELIEQKDHTAEIFEKLGVTPETHPEFYFVLNEDVEWNLANFLDFYPEQDADAQPTSLLSGTPEADGVAVRLYMQYLMREKLPVVIQWSGYHGQWFVGDDHYTSYAHAVHDALAGALGLNKEGERECTE